VFEDRYTVGYRVDQRGLWKELDDERRIEPGLVIGRDDVRRFRDVFETADADPKQHPDEQQDKPPNEPVEPRRLGRERMDQRIERRIDQRPVLGAGVLTWLPVRRGRRGGRG
jgi:hypothetical protein